MIMKFSSSREKAWTEMAMPLGDDATTLLDLFGGRQEDRDQKGEGRVSLSIHYHRCLPGDSLSRIAQGGPGCRMAHGAADQLIPALRAHILAPWNSRKGASAGVICSNGGPYGWHGKRRAPSAVGEGALDGRQ